MKHLLFRARYSGLMSDREIMSVLHGACDEAGAHIRRTTEYPFDPKGFTAVVILAESHATIHTWPEKGFVMVDYFSCSEKPRQMEFMSHFSKSGFTIDTYEVIDRLEGGSKKKC